MAFHAMERLGVARMEDVGVPRGRVPELLAAIERVGAEQGLVIATFGHVGDGNLHPNIILDRDDPDGEAKLHRATDALYRAAIELGGTVTAEHGIGVARRDYLALQRGDGGGRDDAGDQERPRPARHPQSRQGPARRLTIAVARRRGQVKVSSSRPQVGSQDRLTRPASTDHASDRRSVGRDDPESEADTDEMEGAGSRRAAGRWRGRGRPGGDRRSRREPRLGAAAT